VTTKNTADQAELLPAGVTGSAGRTVVVTGTITLAGAHGPPVRPSDAAAVTDAG
jgi:hypothetical protein